MQVTLLSTRGLEVEISGETSHVLEDALKENFQFVSIMDRLITDKDLRNINGAVIITPMFSAGP